MPPERPRWEVFIDRRVERDLRNLPQHVTTSFLRALDALAKDPTTSRSGHDVKKLHGLPGDSYRLRIGDYRVLFTIEKTGRFVRVTSVRHRRQAY